MGIGAKWDGDKWDRAKQESKADAEEAVHGSMGAVTSTRRSARTAFRSRTTRSAPAAKAACACSARGAMHLALGAVRPEERGVCPSPGTDVAGVSPSPGADVAGVSPSPGADVAGVSPVLAQMWAWARYAACGPRGAQDACPP